MAKEAQSAGNLVKNIESSKPVHTVNERARPFKLFFTKFGNDWATTFASALAYSLLTAMLPIAIALVATLGLILSRAGSQGILQQVLGKLPGFNNPATINSITVSIQRATSSAGILVIVAIVLAIFGGSRLFIAIEGCLDIVYRVRPRKSIPRNLVAIGMMVLFIILIPIIIFASTIPGYIQGFLQANPAMKSIPFLQFIAGNFITTYLVGTVSGLIAGFLLFEAIYFIVPNQHISWRNSWRGALAAAIALELFLQLFPLYQANFMKNYVGQIGFAVVLLVFFYYFAVILMLGAEVNAFFFEKVQPLPNDLATFVSTMAGKLNKDRPEVESESHVDPKPTEVKDRAHIEDATQRQEGQTQQKNGQRQQPTSSQATAPDGQQQVSLQTAAPKARKTTTKSSQSSTKMRTTLEVTIGSLLAMFIQLLRLRSRR